MSLPVWSPTQDVFSKRPVMPDAMVSGITRLQQDNIAPLDSERNEISSQIVMHTEYRTKLSLTMGSVRAVLAALEAEDSIILEEVSTMKHVIHPLRGLPNDILLEIFAIGFESVLDVPFQTTMPFSILGILDVKRHPVWIMSHVCQQWRNLVVSSPRFWTRLYLQVATPLVSFTSGHLIRLILSRTGSHPLHVYFIDSAACGLARSSSLSELFAQCHRWETLGLYGALRGLGPLRHSIEGFTSLTTVILRQVVRPRSRRNEYYGMYPNEDDDSDDDYHGVAYEPYPCQETAYSGFLSAEMLTSISLNPLGHFVHCKLPWGTVTDIEWSDPSSDLTHTTAILPTLSSLTTAKLNLDGVGIVAALENATLRQLDIEYTGCSGLILAALRMPSLEELRISGYPTITSVSVEVALLTDGALGALDPATGKNLRVLDVMMTGEADDNTHLSGFVSLLRSTPAVTVLRVRFIDAIISSVDAVFEALHVASGSSPLVPKLTHLSLAGRGGWHTSNALISAIQSRRSGQTQVALLERVDVDSIAFADSDLMNEAEQAFSQLLAEGMQGRMSAGPKNCPRMVSPSLPASSPGHW